jgi:hypothetical protein
VKLPCASLALLLATGCVTPQEYVWTKPGSTDAEYRTAIARAQAKTMRDFRPPPRPRPTFPHYSKNTDYNPAALYDAIERNREQAEFERARDDYFKALMEADGWTLVPSTRK